MANLIVSPKTFITYSLGCRTNQAEMESIGQKLINFGLEQVGKDIIPDLVLLNTCAVTGKAELETRKEIRKLRRLFPKSLLIVLGCAVTAKKKFAINLPEADLFIPNEEKDRVTEILEQKFGSYNKSGHFTVFDNPYLHSGRKFIKIQDGCDLFCSFCLTAHLRGQPKSIPPDEIIKEINYWVEKGIVEIILTGINIALYGKEEKYKITITHLLEQILEKTNAERITLSSIYPEMLTEDFLGLIIKEPRISRCFHLSLQSGSRTVLKRMNREIDLLKAEKKLLFLKKKTPEFTFRADIIVGFPGETEKEFKETLDFIKKTKISFVHSFTFSVRPNTKAEEFLKSGQWRDIPKEIKKERQKTLLNEVEKIRKSEAKRLTGKETKCLVIRKKENYYEGLTENGWLIKLSNHPIAELRIKGKTLPVKITKYNKYLFGRITQR